MLKIRAEIPTQDRWNVEALYPDTSVWLAEFQALRGGGEGPYWPELKSYQGLLADPSATASLLDRFFELDRKLTKLFMYAHLRHDEDLGDDLLKRNFRLIQALQSDFSLETSWIEPELLGLSEETFAQLISHPKLRLYQYYFQKLKQRRSHTLSPELEELFALSTKSLDASENAFRALNDVDLTFKEALDSKGQKHSLTLGAYPALLESPDRALRQSAFENICDAYERHINTFCELLQGKVQVDLYSARARKFKSCLEAALYPHQIDPKVYDNLICSVRNHLPALHKYVALRKKILGLSEHHIYDLEVPLVAARQSIPYDKARQLVLEAVAPLGDRYMADLRKGLFEERWVDVYENARKRSGAYSSASYDTLPYILLNYNNTLRSAETLAHEAGHSMHSLLSHRHQPYVYARYPIFLAEIASTFNEFLFFKHLKDKAPSQEELASLLEKEIGLFVGAFFRQTLFAEFEKQIHEWAEEGTPLTPALLNKCYLQLANDYYGPDMVIDSQLGNCWSRLPHFYYNFYVYQYATGLSAAFSLFKKATVSSEARDRYLEFLSSGESAPPLELLQRAGVDMRQSAPIDEALEHFEQLVNALERCFA